MNSFVAKSMNASLRKRRLVHQPAVFYIGLGDDESGRIKPRPASPPLPSRTPRLIAARHSILIAQSG